MWPMVRDGRTFNTRGWFVMGAMALAAAQSGFGNDTAEITFSRHIAPIFAEHCVTCHRPGAIGPMALTSYENARPWAKAIRREVAARRMPPWHADSPKGMFANDISLSAEEIGLITRWVDAGAPRGEGDGRIPVPHESSRWKLGTPDVVLPLPSVAIPASGPDKFVNHVVHLDLPEARWIRGVEVRPGNRRVNHHLIGFVGFFPMLADETYHLGMDGSPIAEGARRTGTAAAKVLAIWAAGSPPTEFPPGTGHGLSRKAVLTFNVHYHPDGAATTDQSEIGIYFGDGGLKQEVATAFAIDTGILVPAGAADYRAHATHLFSRPVKLLSFFPHMHVRGKAMTYRLAYPDGRTDMVLNVPRYDFDWQWIYRLAEPIRVPAGTRLIVEAAYDNSSANPDNPNPAIDVPFGDGTNDEMLVGFVEYVPAGDESMPVSEQIEMLLARHPAEEIYAGEATSSIMGFRWGMHLPRVGRGALYLVGGSYVLSPTLRAIVWDGPNVSAHSGMILPNGHTVPLRMEGTVEHDGHFEGKLYLDASEDMVFLSRGIPIRGKRGIATLETTKGGE